MANDLSETPEVVLITHPKRSTPTTASLHTRIQARDVGVEHGKGKEGKREKAKDAKDGKEETVRCIRGEKRKGREK